jgi:ribosomal protein S6
VKDISHKVVAGGGIVRSIQNHGIRDLPHRFRSKYPDREGVRYYEKGRFISIYYDSSPSTLRDVEEAIRLHDIVLRTTHLKARNPLWDINIAREDKNPYIQKVLAREKASR